MAGDNDKVAELEGQVSDMEAQVKDLTKALEAATKGDADAAEAAKLQGQVDTLVSKVEDLSSALEQAISEKDEAENMAKALAEMDEDERAYFKQFPFPPKKKAVVAVEGEEEEEEPVANGNGNGKKKPFWLMSKQERKEMIKAEKANDEVATIEGRVISKRAVGADAFEILKAQAARIAKSEADMAREIEKRETVEFQKRAQESYAHIPGTLEERGNILRALSKMDEPLRKSFETIIESAEKLSKAGFDKIGTKAGRPGDESIEKKARDFESRFDKVRVDFPKLTRADALAKARRENPDLFKAYQEHGEEVARNGN